MYSILKFIIKTKTEKFNMVVKWTPLWSCRLTTHFLLKNLLSTCNDVYFLAMLFPYESINYQFKMKHQPIRNVLRHKKKI